MSNAEFSREFDILYNNIMSNTAPGIDEYEKSVFLTKALEHVVTAIYDGSFEGSEKFRESLSFLVRTLQYNSIKNAVSGARSGFSFLNNNINSTYFPLPDDCMYIVLEHLIPMEPNLCDKKDMLLVVPVTHDQVSKFLENPFKRPNKKRAFRLNNYPLISAPTGPPLTVRAEINNVEIITSSEISDYYYFIRYVKRPNPIVLYTDTTITVDGLNIETLCELDPSLHRVILDAAVKLAVETYKLFS